MDRYKQAHELLSIVKDCGQRAGIYENMFIAFGSALGAIRPSYHNEYGVEPHYRTGLLQWDKDLDIGILKDRCNPGQLENYFNYCCQKGLMSYWGNINDRQQRRRDNGSLLWFSVKKGKNTIKMCNWMFFDFNGYSFHSKGRKWLTARKLQYVDPKIKKQSQALGKGVPAKYLRELTEVEFEGVKFNIPLLSGTLLDMWYPSWHIPHKGGASRKEAVLIVREWADPGTWKIQT